MHENAKFLIFNVFQGNAATQLRCGGQPNIGFVAKLVLFTAVKQFAKPSRIDKVIAVVRVAPFLTHGVFWTPVFVGRVHRLRSTLPAAKHVSIFQPSLAIGAELMIYMYIHEQKTSENEVNNDYQKLGVPVMVSVSSPVEKVYSTN